MTTNLKLLDLGKMAEAMKLTYDIEGALIGNSNTLATGIKANIGTSPDVAVLRELKTMIEDNRPMMVNLLGEGIVNRINEY